MLQLRFPTLSRVLSVASLPPSAAQSQSPRCTCRLRDLLRPTLRQSALFAVVAAVLVLATLIPSAQAQVALTPGLLTVYAGTGQYGRGGDNGPATAADFNTPAGVAVDAFGNVFIADNQNQVIRRVDALTGIITTFAGIAGESGTSGDGGPAIDAKFDGLAGIAFDTAGNLYIADEEANEIRKIVPSGIISRVAGNYCFCYFGDGGPATESGLDQPESVALDSSGNLYIADSGNNAIRRVDAVTGIITTVAGSGNIGYRGDGGPATLARLYDPQSVAVDSAGNLYIADSDNNVIRKVSGGIISTVVGNGFLAGDNYGFFDNFSGGLSGDGGPATAAELYHPSSILVDPAGDLYIADQQNARVRFVNTAQVITTIAGSGPAYPVLGGDITNDVAATSTTLTPASLAFDPSYNLYISDNFDNLVLKVDVSQAVLNFPTPTVAGTFDFNDGFQAITLTNIGNTPINNPLPSTNVQVTSGFVYAVGQAPVCPVLQPGASCSIPVAFLPPAGSNGTIDGTAKFAENSGSGIGTKTVSLTGNATTSPDFYLKAFPAIFSVVPGQPGTRATVLIEAHPLNGFQGTVSLETNSYDGYYTAYPNDLPSATTHFFWPAASLSPVFNDAALAVFQLPQGTAPGVYSLSVAGISGSLAHSITLNINVP